jgi:hypothetical protein
MGIADVRAALVYAGEGQLRFNDVLMHLVDGKQVIEANGWHNDGTPFDITSEPFSGEPGEMARRIAGQLVIEHRMTRSMIASSMIASAVTASPVTASSTTASTATASTVTAPTMIPPHTMIAPHTMIEDDSMTAPAPIAGLAATLRDHLTQATARADAVARRAKDSVGNLHAVLDAAEGTVAQLDAAAADIQSALGLSTNGGPGLEQK